MFDVDEDRIMPPSVTALITCVLTVNQYVMEGALGRPTELTSGGLNVAPEFEDIWGAN